MPTGFFAGTATTATFTLGDDSAVTANFGLSQTNPSSPPAGVTIVNSMPPLNDSPGTTYTYIPPPVLATPSPSSSISSAWSGE